MRCRGGVKVTVVADRGFGNGPGIQCLEALGFEYVLRIRGDFYVTNAEGERATRTLSLIRRYARRWGIETRFRDLKDMRFGMGMSAMRIRHPERHDRMLMLSALSIALLTLLGAAGESMGYDRWLKANTVKTRTHSLFRQGLMLYEPIPNWPEHRLRPLVEKFVLMLMEQRAYREVFGVI